VVGTNSPRNYAGQTGTIDATPGPPAVPGMRVDKLLPYGSSLSLTWATATCGSTTHSILYGDRTQLPLAPGGAFVLAGSVCGVGASPYTWNPTPTPVSGPLLWWLIVALDGAGLEGSWGLDGAGAERVGPGAGSSSGGVTNKDASNTCGQ
jgi:hypothetical protein